MSAPSHNEHHHDHAHGHGHAGHAHAAPAEPTTVEQDAQLLSYMVEHNLEHKEELQACKQALEAKGYDKAAAHLQEAVASLESSIEQMRSALESL